MGIGGCRLHGYAVGAGLCVLLAAFGRAHGLRPGVRASAGVSGVLRRAATALAPGVPRQHTAFASDASHSASSLLSSLATASFPVPPSSSSRSKLSLARPPPPRPPTRSLRLAADEPPAAARPSEEFCTFARTVLGLERPRRGAATGPARPLLAFRNPKSPKTFVFFDVAREAVLEEMPEFERAWVAVPTGSLAPRYYFWDTGDGGRGRFVSWSLPLGEAPLLDELDLASISPEAALLQWDRASITPTLHELQLCGPRLFHRAAEDIGRCRILDDPEDGSSFPADALARSFDLSVAHCKRPEARPLLQSGIYSLFGVGVEDNARSAVVQGSALHWAELLLRGAAPDVSQPFVNFRSHMHIIIAGISIRLHDLREDTGLAIALFAESFRLLEPSDRLEHCSFTLAMLSAFDLGANLLPSGRQLQALQALGLPVEVLSKIIDFGTSRLEADILLAVNFCVAAATNDGDFSPDFLRALWGAACLPMLDAAATAAEAFAEAARTQPLEASLCHRTHFANVAACISRQPAAVELPNADSVHVARRAEALLAGAAMFFERLSAASRHSVAPGVLQLCWALRQQAAVLHSVARLDALESKVRAVLASAAPPPAPQDRRCP